MKKLFTLIIILFAFSTLRAQEEKSLVKWLTFNEAQKLDSINPKPWLIDVYTDWCGWCKRMMATTFSHPQIAEYINHNFYPVRFDAETSDTITFFGREYYPLKSNRGGYISELAYLLLNNQLSYPTIVYINRQKDYSLATPSFGYNPVAGYMTISDIEPYLLYYAENLNTSVNIDEFLLYYMTNFKDSFKDKLERQKNLPKFEGKIDWKPLREVLELQKKDPRPIILDIQIPEGGLLGEIQKNVVFSDKQIADTINKYFWAATFDAVSDEEITMFNHVFKREYANGPHSLVSALLNNVYQFPAFVFFNHENRIAGRVQSFFGVSTWQIIIDYYREQAYLKENFNNYFERKTTSR